MRGSFLTEDEVEEVDKLCQRRMKRSLTDTHPHTPKWTPAYKLDCQFYRIPVQYLIEGWEFRYIGLKLKPPVFIPVPETEVRGTREGGGGRRKHKGYPSP